MAANVWLLELNQVVAADGLLSSRKGSGRGKRVSESSQGDVRSVRGRGRGQSSSSQSYRPPRSTASNVDLNIESHSIEDNGDDDVDAMPQFNTVYCLSNNNDYIMHSWLLFVCSY